MLQIRLSFGCLRNSFWRFRRIPLSFRLHHYLFILEFDNVVLGIELFFELVVLSLKPVGPLTHFLCDLFGLIDLLFLLV